MKWPYLSGYQRQAILFSSSLLSCFYVVQSQHGVKDFSFEAGESSGSFSESAGCMHMLWRLSFLYRKIDALKEDLL
ncbi:hypothetical protein BDW67DRAFT_166131 [Aspergillus spinulosporus]